ncbi:hypothetical protein [Trichothermofontia sp.]
MQDENVQDENTGGSGRRSIQMLLDEGYVFNIGDYISRGWRIFESNLALMVVYTVLVGVIGSLLAGIDTFLFRGNVRISPVIGILITSPLLAGFYLGAFKRLNNQNLEFGDFFKGFQWFAPLVLSFIASQFFILVGSAFCLIPGIYLATAYQLIIPLILDRNMNFWEAMETSRKIVTKQWFAWFVFGLLMGVINIGGLIACFVGIFFTIPLTYCMWVAAYEDVVGIQRTNI